MAVSIISSVKYVSGKRIRLPRRSLDNLVRGYEIKNGDVNCFYCDNRKELELNMFEVPSGAKEMEFAEMDFYGEKVVGGPVYYDDGGNVVKVGNH